MRTEHSDAQRCEFNQKNANFRIDLPAAKDHSAFSEESFRSTEDARRWSQPKSGFEVVYSGFSGITNSYSLTEYALK